MLMSPPHLPRPLLLLVLTYHWYSPSSSFDWSLVAPTHFCIPTFSSYSCPFFPFRFMTKLSPTLRHLGFGDYIIERERAYCAGFSHHCVPGIWECVWGGLDNENLMKVWSGPHLEVHPHHHHRQEWLPVLIRCSRNVCKIRFSNCVIFLFFSESCQIYKLPWPPFASSLSQVRSHKVSLLFTHSEEEEEEEVGKKSREKDFAIWQINYVQWIISTRNRRREREKNLVSVSAQTKCFT